ncbi:hypothetical protein C8J56DRAFT_1161017 [Mycena floridula]|nr:hypothetical protein C8J56DRAFT_1161017 [Mycena floridula]
MSSSYLERIEATSTLYITADYKEEFIPTILPSMVQRCLDLLSQDALLLQFMVPWSNYTLSMDTYTTLELKDRISMLNAIQESLKILKTNLSFRIVHDQIEYLAFVETKWDHVSKPRINFTPVLFELAYPSRETYGFEKACLASKTLIREIPNEDGAVKVKVTPPSYKFFESRQPAATLREGGEMFESAVFGGLVGLIDDEPPFKAEGPRKMHRLQVTVQEGEVVKQSILQGYFVSQTVQGLLKFEGQLFLWPRSDVLFATSHRISLFGQQYRNMIKAAESTKIGPHFLSKQFPLSIK